VYSKGVLLVSIYLRRLLIRRAAEAGPSVPSTPPVTVAAQKNA